MSRTAGRIEDADKAEAEKRGPSKGDNPFKAAKSSIEHDQKLMAGLLRKTSAHHVWGQSPEGEAVVEPILTALQARHEKALEAGETDTPWNNVEVNLRNQHRAEEFLKLSPSKQARWRTIAASKKEKYARCSSVIFADGVLTILRLA